MKPGGRTLDDLDRLDLTILAELQQQGRTPNSKIARTVGVSEPTVRKRIDRMVQDGIIKVVAVLDPRSTHYATDVLIGIRCAPGRLLEVGEAIAALDNCVYLGYTTGRFDILVELLFRDDAALFQFLNERVPSMSGIVGTETSHVLRTEKINYDWKLPSDVNAAHGSHPDAPASLTVRDEAARPNGKGRASSGRAAASPGPRGR